MKYFVAICKACDAQGRLSDSSSQLLYMRSHEQINNHKDWVMGIIYSTDKILTEFDDLRNSPE